MRHPDVIRTVAQIYKPKTYLELGLYSGETFNAVKPFCQRMIGVDINPVTLQGEIHTKTTDQFFEEFDECIDMAFIDADHKYESALKDFENCLSRLNDGGIILIHDADPISDDLFDFAYCGDSYRLIDELESREDVNIITLPVHTEGLCLVTKVKDTRCHRRS